MTTTPKSKNTSKPQTAVTHIKITRKANNDPATPMLLYFFIATPPP
jgi:hypothetical protein